MMKTHANKAQENKNASVVNKIAQKQAVSESESLFEDNRPEVIARKKLQEDINSNSRVQQLTATQQLANNNPRVLQLQAIQGKARTGRWGQMATQLQAMAMEHTQQKMTQFVKVEEEGKEEGPFQRKPETVQCAASSKEDGGKPLQRKFEVTQKQSETPAENKTGLPDNLKSGIEQLSGHTMDDVKVHYNSDRPAQLNAHAYAQGTDIHITSGQEKHLPHEAWHVAQQKQGRVKPTKQLKEKVNINDDADLEKEADVMGAKALQMVEEPLGGALQRKSQTVETAQLVANIPAGKGGMCGPSVLSGVLDALGVDAKTKEEIINVATSETGSSLGEIFTYADMHTIADAIGLKAIKHTFRNEVTLLSALTATGANPVLAAISNVGFPGKERASYDERLTEAGVRWVRAHWIAITNFNAKSKSITYKDNGNDGGTVAMASKLVDNNAMLNDTWDWDTWGKESGGKVPKEKAGTQEVMDLTGYIVEFQRKGDVGLKQGGGGCYITTACTQAKGLPDDCEELTILRKFRDTHLLHKDSGASLIASYYKHAPGIVQVIRSREDEKKILERLYGIIKQCVEAIKKGDNEFAFNTYCKMVVQLKEEFLPDTKVVTPEVHEVE